ncbi:unnamed protein product, partial [Scytosiphon promiscuus]
SRRRTARGSTNVNPTSGQPGCRSGHGALRCAHGLPRLRSGVQGLERGVGRTPDDHQHYSHISILRVSAALSLRVRLAQGRHPGVHEGSPPRKPRPLAMRQ